jgi:D-arginine dehydrogenase
VALLRPRGVIHVAGEAEADLLAALASEESKSGAVVPMAAAEILRRVPILRPAAVAVGLFEAGAMDIDVDALHQGYLRGLKRRGGTLVVEAGVMGLERQSGVWTARTAAGDFVAPVVVDAAGAWADQLAVLAGARPVGLAPKRRTAAIVEGPPGDIADWPMVVDARETIYFKPDAGRLLISPADETDSAPMDAYPEELDVAIAVDRLEALTTLEVHRVLHKWAGLRTFAPDRSPVCGYDPEVEGFFWLAGQGGYGIQTAPAMARLASALVRGCADTDKALLALAGDLAPRRFRAS